MKKKLFLSLVCSLTAIYSIAQNSGTCGENLNWNFDSETGKLSISGTGEMQDCFFNFSLDIPWDDFRPEIKQVEIEEGVTSIGSGAFFACHELISVSIPNSITHIGDFAFCMCSGLLSVTIPNNVTSIGEFAFAGTNALASVIIPGSVTNIGRSAFDYCTSLQSIEVEDENPSYSSENGVLFNKSKTTLICYPAGKTASYTIPDSVTTLGDWAFYACTGLDSISLPNSVRSIGKSVFYGCSGLTSIVNNNPVPVKIDADVFHEVDKTACILSVPEGAVDSYQQAEVWGEFQVMAIKETNIQEIPVINSIQIYPNPVAESFRMRGIEENTMVRVWDLSGRMVLQQRVSPDEAVDVRHLPKGVYLVQGKGKTGRLMKE